MSVPKACVVGTGVANHRQAAEPTAHAKMFGEIEVVG